MGPAVSVIIPAYNGERTIRQAISSVLDQTDVPGSFELIVVDDASTDGTAEIVRSYGAALTSKVQAINSGVSSAVNHAASSSRAKYVAFLHDDDFFLPNKLSTIVAALDRNSEAVLAFSDYLACSSETNQPIGVVRFDHAPTLEEMFLRWGVVGPPSTIVVRRTCFDAVGGFDPRLRWAEDINFVLRARQQGPFVHVPSPLTVYRQRTSIKASEVRYPVEQMPAFESVMKEHFGKRADALITHAHDQRAAMLLGMALLQFDEVQRVEAARTLYRLIRYRPSYLWRHAGIRGFCRKNLRRLLGVP